MKGIIKIENKKRSYFSPGFKVSKWGLGVFLDNNTIFFIAGKVIAKGCSAVVYTAKQVEQKVRTWQTNNNRLIIIIYDHTNRRAGYFD